MNINTSPGGSPRYPLVAALLVGVVAVLLGGGWFASQHFRGQVGTEPAPSVAAPSPQAAAPADVAVPAAVTAASPAAVASVAASPAPSFHVASSPLEREIEQAYLHYWDVYAQEAASGDTSRLTEVLAGDALKWTSDEINERRSQGRGVKISVQHLYSFRNVGPDAAEVDDQYLDQSQWVDLGSGALQSRQGSANRVTQAFQLRLLDGAWKVVGGTR